MLFRQEPTPVEDSKPKMTTVSSLQLNKENVENAEKPKALSPSLQNVSQIKNWITNMEKVNKKKSEEAWKRPKLPLKNKGNQLSRGRSRQASSKVQEMRQRLSAKKPLPLSNRNALSTPVAETRNVKIPMNKVQEMKKILLDFKRQQAKQKEMMHMSSKKRAKISERLNRVEDIQKWLNEMEQQSKSKTSAQKNISAPKTKELNLPMNRVNEMKNWLIEFEMQNKEHSNRFTNKGASGGKFQYGGAYIPTKRNKQESSNLSVQKQIDEIASNRHIVDVPGTTADVSNLAQFLIDFEQKNKDHYEKSQRKGCDMSTSSQNTTDLFIENKDNFFEIKKDEEERDDASADEHEDKEEDDEFEENADNCEEESKEQLIVENTSIVDISTSHNDIDMSMMPTTNNLDQSEWNDEYDDLMKVDIHIEQVQSAESWEDESFASSAVSEDEEINDHHINHGEENEEDHELGNEEASSHMRDTSVLYNEEISLVEDILNDTSLNEQSEEYTDDFDYSKEDDLSQSIDNVQSEDLMGEDILSTSHSGARFSTSFMLHPENLSFCEQADTKSVVVDNKAEQSVPIESELKDRKERKSGGLKCVYKSLFRIIIPKKKKSVVTNAHFVDGGIEMVESVPEREDAQHALRSQPFVHEKVIQKSSPYHANHTDSGYLPTLYTTKEDEPQDFARDMLLNRECRPFDPTCESPMSLASAFRREMSPTSSSCADSEISCFEALLNVNHKSTNVAQHVGWLNNHFHSPKTCDDMKKSEQRYFPTSF